LCVDDNHDCADSLALLLNVVGFEARACYDGPTALSIAEEFRPELGVLDLNMPIMAGDELARRLAEWAADCGRPLVLVAVTARSDEESRERTRAAGFDQHFVKPIHLNDLLAVTTDLARARAHVRSG